MKFFGRFNLVARDNALRGIALHSLLLMLYERADEYSDGVGLYIREACQQLHDENAQSIAMLRDNMEGMAAIQRSRNVTDWLVSNAESKCGLHPTVSHLREYLLSIELNVRAALQEDYRSGYLPHIDDRQWLEYWQQADCIIPVRRVSSCPSDSVRSVLGSPSTSKYQPRNEHAEVKKRHKDDFEVVCGNCGMSYNKKNMHHCQGM